MSKCLVESLELQRKVSLIAAAASLLMLTSISGTASAQSKRSTPAQAHLTIDTSTIISPVSPTLYGMMTEEINHAFDGGLYAELVQNRTFRNSWEGFTPWGLVEHGDSSAAIDLDATTGPSKALSSSLKLVVKSASASSEAGVGNPGYWGIAAKPNTAYSGSFYGMVDDASVGSMGSLHVRLINDGTGKVLASAEVPLHGGPWSAYQYTLKTAAIAASFNNHLEFTVAAPGTLHLQLVSLMPPTFHDRPNGNRSDLMERMAGMHPHFLRLPGGNYLEGDRLEDWYNWKQTIGPLVDRPGHQAPWSYWSTDGLGLLEFLEWCEDLKIEPVLAVYAGYALHGDHYKPGADLQPYVQSALDEVEYVTGDVNTRWGAERAKDGHPAPFPLHYIEIGNEDQFDNSKSYDARFTQFANALRKQYPQYKLIATTSFIDKDNKTIPVPDAIDDHYYLQPFAMMDMVHHYDKMPRNGVKVFVGEWATRSGTPTPNFGDALGDAALMTSLERNSDLIVMASYAPLLVNVNPGAMQWSTDLIGFNAQTTYASPSYYAQALFAGHIGDGTPQSSISGAGARFFYSATVGSQDHVLHLKLVNATSEAQPLSIDLSSIAGKKSAKVMSLHGSTYEATNSITNPDFIHPTESTVQLPAKSWQHTVPGLTIEVIDIPLK